MTRRKRKPVSFDAMVKFFIRNYEIPTRKDIDTLTERLERIEKLILSQPAARKSAGAGGRQVKAGGASVSTASDEVLGIIKGASDGLKLTDIQAVTGYGEKKLRNIIFRLHSTRRIKRVARGVYTAE